MQIAASERLYASRLECLIQHGHNPKDVIPQRLALAMPSIGVWRVDWISHRCADAFSCSALMS